MIHVDLMPEPPDFDSKVRQPGNAFLEAHPTPTGKELKKRNYWNRCSLQLYRSYHGICAYTGLWFSIGTTDVSVDHYYPKSLYPEKAYEWDNYRLTTQKMNGYKGEKIVLDPFAIKNGDIVLEFPSCLVKPRKSMTPAEKSKAKSTIQILHLNVEEQIAARCAIVMDYVCERFNRGYLEEKFPFIAEELERQNLYDKIKHMMKMPSVHDVS